MKYPDSHLPATNELVVDFTAALRQQAEAKKLSSKEVNNLPDSDFAYISPGGKKDSEGKTVPRSLRHLPIPDAAHVRNALARLDQTDIPPAAKKEALAKIKRKAKEFDIEVSESGWSKKKSAASDKGAQEKLEKKEYHQDKDELDSETLKERLKHHQDAVKNLQQEIKKLEQDKKEDKKDVKEESSAAKTKKEWDKIDKKELKKDSPKEKVEHEKDAIKDDKDRIKKDEKGAPSAKKKREVKDLKRDEKFDKKSEKEYQGKAAVDFPKVAFKPAPFDGVLESAPYSKLLEPVDWDKLKKELNLNNLWFKKAEPPTKDYKKYLDPNYTP